MAISNGDGHPTTINRNPYNRYIKPYEIGLMSLSPMELLGPIYRMYIWKLPKMVVQYPATMGKILLKTIILGCEMGVPPFQETPVCRNTSITYIL